MTLIQFANAFAVAITFARWRRRSEEATALPYGAIFCCMLLKTDFTSRFPARAAYAVKDLPKVGMMFDSVFISLHV